MNLTKVINENAIFINGEYKVYFSPGRVNLIGEHIDYLGGNVFPAAISLGTYAIVSRRDDYEFHFLSHNFKNVGEKVVKLDNLDYDDERSWVNYPSGMIQAFINLGMKIDHGLNILIYGTLPNSSGLSSSASLEVLIGTVMKDEYKFNINSIDIVKTSQSVENHYIGVNCGIMDQFAVGMSKEDKAIYLNTETLEHKFVPLILGDYTLVIANTNKSRALADSKYNERRSECDDGLASIKESGIHIDNLCQLTPREFDELGNIFASKTIKNRVEHAVNENDRTKNAVVALETGNLQLFGELMNYSHDSLKELYEVSCLELDTLVDSFRKYGSIGSRMTGAGFGGCTISLVPTKNVEDIVEKVSKDYFEKIGYKADFYLCKTSDGARVLREEDIK